MNITATVWICVQLVVGNSTLLVGHDPAYQWGVQVHATGSDTTYSVGDCMYYLLSAECERVYDRHDPQFTTTYLCEVGDAIR